MNKDKLGGIGASEIGALFVRDGIKSKSAQSLAFKKAKELITGFKEVITTKQMEHGILHEFSAFQTVVEPLFPESILQSEQSYFFKEGLWATPDVITSESVIDIKCPYSIYTYHQGIKSVKSIYSYQVNMQMIATNKSKGYLCYYLTKPLDKDGYKKEYEIPLKERFHFLEVDKLDSFENEMFKRFDEFKLLRDLIYSDLLDSFELDDVSCNSLHKSKKVTKFKDKSNLTTWGGCIVLWNNDYYVVE